MDLAGEERLDLSLKTNVGNVASVATGPTSAKIVAVDVVVTEAEEEAAREDAEADPRKYQTQANRF